MKKQATPTKEIKNVASKIDIKLFKSSQSSSFFGPINVIRESTTRVNDGNDKQLCDLKLRVSRVEWKILREKQKYFKALNLL